jgi:hypothetical protein
MVSKTLTLRLDDDNSRHKAALESLEYIKETWNIKTDSGAILMWLQMAEHKTVSKYKLERELEELQTKYDDLRECLSDKNDIESRIMELLK